MTDLVIIAIITGIPATLAAAASAIAVVASLKNSRKIDANTVTTDATNVKVAEVGATADKIHEVTNSNYQKLNAKFDALVAKSGEQDKTIQVLKDQIRDMTDDKVAARIEAQVPKKP